ncbi:MAG TPA: hypothetical protein VF666_10985 [Pyrinomonadaceae bacterium]|jgi:hypothetical protein
MRLYESLKRARPTLVALLLLTAVTSGTLIWHSTADSKEDKRAAETKQKQHERLRKGIGSEVRFAAANDTPEQVRASVNSAAEFIDARSGLKMSNETRERLTEAEINAAQGKEGRISVEKLTDIFTEVVTDRVATLTDQEVEQAADAYSTPEGEISSRGSRKWGAISRDEFIGQVKAAREWSRRGDAALRVAVRPMMKEEVDARISVLSESLPESFGRAKAEGVTPLQAVVIGYSVASDDPLADSRNEFAEQKRRNRMSSGLTRSEARSQKRRVSDRPFGLDGFSFSSPVNLIFNRAAVDKIVNHGKGGQTAK